MRMTIDGRCKEIIKFEVRTFTEPKATENWGNRITNFQTTGVALTEAKEDSVLRTIVP